MKTKLILTAILVSTILLQGCGLQKMIEQAINKLRAVEVVTGTVHLTNATDHSNTKIEVNGRSTKTDVNGNFRLLVNSSPAQSVNELVISHTGFITENVIIPAETENGEYSVNKYEGLKRKMTTVTINVVCDQTGSYMVVGNSQNSTWDHINKKFNPEFVTIEYKRSQDIEITTSDNIEYVFVFPTFDGLGVMDQSDQIMHTYYTMYCDYSDEARYLSDTLHQIANDDNANGVVNGFYLVNNIRVSSLNEVFRKSFKSGEKKLKFKIWFVNHG